MRSVLCTTRAVVAALVALTGMASAQDASELTLYRTRVEGGHTKSGPLPVAAEAHAIVVERRAVAVKSGINRIRLGRLPATISAGSLRVRAVDPEAAIVRSYRLLGPQTPRGRPTGGRVDVEIDTGRTISGTPIVSSPEIVVLRDRQRLRVVPASVIESSRPGDGATAIEVVLEASRPGRPVLEVSYRANHIRWDVAYTAIRSGDSVELSASLEIDNKSGASFPRAGLAVVDRVLAPRPRGSGNPAGLVHPIDSRTAAAAGVGAVAAGESERELWTAEVEASEVVVIDHRARGGLSRALPRVSCATFSQPSSSSSRRVLELPLGRERTAAMTPGAVRLLDRTAGGRLSPAAEVELDIDHRAGVARIAVERTSAVLVLRQQQSCETADRQLTETVEVEVRNATSDTVVALVNEPLGRSGSFVVTEETAPGRAIAGGRQYRLELAPGVARTVRYTAAYYW